MNLSSLTDLLTGIIPNDDFMCSYCGFGDFGGFHGYKPNYCPNCGMRVNGVNATTELDKTELDKLEVYLKENNYNYSREKVISRNQIIVYNHDGKRMWDAICQSGSYGYEDGLIEIMGCIVEENVENGVEGWLTAEDVIQRLRSIENICSSDTLKGMDKAVENMKNNNVSDKLDLSEFEEH